MNQRELTALGIDCRQRVIENIPEELHSDKVSNGIRIKEIFSKCWCKWPIIKNGECKQCGNKKR